MTRKEKRLVVIAGIIFAIFMLAKVIPSVKNFYQKQVQAIEEIKMKKERFEKLEVKADFWEGEYKNARETRKKIHRALLKGDTPELISASIQSTLRSKAKKTGVEFKSMELGESAIVGEWVLVTQVMRFEATSESFFNFLAALSQTRVELIVTDLDIRSYKGRIMGKIKVSGFSRPPLKEVKHEEGKQATDSEKAKETVKEPEKSEVQPIEGVVPANSDNGQPVPVVPSNTGQPLVPTVQPAPIIPPDVGQPLPLNNMQPVPVIPPDVGQPLPLNNTQPVPVIPPDVGQPLLPNNTQPVPVNPPNTGQPLPPNNGQPIENK